MVDLITLPACDAYNNGSSPEDEDLRFYISLQVGKQTPRSTALWDQGAHKSLKRNINLRFSVLARARDVRVADVDGKGSSLLLKV